MENWEGEHWNRRVIHVHQLGRDRDREVHFWVTMPGTSEHIVALEGTDQRQLEKVMESRFGLHDVRMTLPFERVDKSWEGTYRQAQVRLRGGTEMGDPEDWSIIYGRDDPETEEDERREVGVWAEWRGQYARVVTERSTTHEKLREKVQRAFGKSANEAATWVIITEMDYEERDLPPRERVEHISGLFWDEVVHVREATRRIRSGYPPPEEIIDGYEWSRSDEGAIEIEVLAWNARVKDRAGQSFNHEGKLGPPPRFKWKIHREETMWALRRRWNTRNIEREH
jgi:hypothetical protein